MASERERQSGWLFIAGTAPGPAANGGALECARTCCEGLRALWEPLQWFGDKTPDYVNHWPTLRALFPDCRVIVMDRPVEEVLPSIRSCDWPWLEGKSDEELRTMLARWRDNAEQIPGAHRVDMRALSREPERVVAGVLDWLDLDHDSYPWTRAVGQVLEPTRKVN